MINFMRKMAAIAAIAVVSFAGVAARPAKADILQIPVALVVDTTDNNAINEALEEYAGRPIYYAVSTESSITVKYQLYLGTDGGTVLPSGSDHNDRVEAVTDYIVEHADPFLINIYVIQYVSIED